MKDGYSVMRFSLQRRADGTLTQDVQRCGDFQSVETAMNTARMEALREWYEVCEQEATTTPVVKKIQIRDTEWGYELKREHLVVTRYWVHDASPADIPGLPN